MTEATSRPTLAKMVYLAWSVTERREDIMTFVKIQTIKSLSPKPIKEFRKNTIISVQRGMSRLWTKTWLMLAE